MVMNFDMSWLLSRCVKTVTVRLRQVRWRLQHRGSVTRCCGMWPASHVQAVVSCSSASATAARMVASTVRDTTPSLLDHDVPLATRYELATASSFYILCVFLELVLLSSD